MKFFSSFKFKFIIIIGIIMSSICLLLTFVSITKTIDITCSIYGRQAFPILNEAKTLLNGNDIERLATSNNSQDPAYERMRKDLYKLKINSNCKFLYTMAAVKGNIYKYLIDGSSLPDDIENFSPIGTEEDMTADSAAISECLSKKTTTVSKLNQMDDWGWVVTIFAPILNNKGDAIGVIACDFDADFLALKITEQKRTMWIICIVFIIVCIVLLLVVSIPFFNSLKNVSLAMKAIASDEGDLSSEIPIKTNDEVAYLAQSCNSVITKLRSVVKQIKEAITLLAKTCSDLKESTTSEKESFDIATKSITEIDTVAKEQNNCMNEVVDGIKKVWAEIENLDSKLGEEAIALEKSSSAVEEMASSIASVDNSVEKISKEYSVLVIDSNNGKHLQQEVIKKVDIIVNQSRNLMEANTIINDIAERTNLLAMNAAIEAAHAGVLGKGFAVVAGEIRHLAETSSQQSSSIGSLLAGINSAIKDIVSSSSNSEKAFEEIVTRIEKIDKMMHEVSYSMNEQNVGVKEILDTVKVINNTSDSIAQASKSMKDQSKIAFSGIDILRTCTKDVLEKTDNISSQMKNMDRLSTISAQAAQENQNISNSVANLINSFKTE